MKTAIYIKNGLTQLVLTPEDEFEKGIVENIDKGKHDVAIYTGSFYQCRGGWVREGADDESLIIVMEIKADEH
jgi:hypothetical protein